MYLFLLGEGDVQLIFGDDTFIYQNLTQAPGFIFRVHRFASVSIR
jgi:hypothetical protein